MLRLLILAMVFISLVFSADIPSESINLQRDTAITPNNFQYYKWESHNYLNNPSENVQTEVIGKRLADTRPLNGFYGGAVVLTGEDLARTGAKTVPDILQQYGLVKFSDGTGNDLDWTLNWRGFNSGADIVVIVDGIKVNEADDNVVYWSNIPVSDIAKIELIPGAQSAQYGSGAFAGVINIITKKQPENDLELSSGSYGYGRQLLNLGVQRGIFSYHVNYDRQAATGYRYNSGYKSENLSGKLSWDLGTEQINIYHKSGGADLRYPVQLTVDELAADRTRSPIHNTRLIQTSLTNLEYNKELDSDWSLALNLGGRTRAIDYTSLSKTNPVDDLKLRETETDHSYLGQLSWQNRLIFGYDYHLADINSLTYGYDRVAKVKLDKTFDFQATKGEYAPYFQYFEKFGGAYLRYGAREDRVDYVNYDQLNKVRQSDKVFSKRTHNGELGYEFLPEITGYVSYGEAFKAPSFSQLFRSSSVWYLPNPNLTPELAKTESAGLRWNTKTQDLSWSVFQTRVEDEIVFVGDPLTFLSKNENARKTVRNGFNIVATERLGQWGLFADYTFTKARFVDYVSGWGDDYEGYALPLTPEQVYSIGVNYQWPNVKVNLIQNYVGRQFLGDDLYNEDEPLPAYTFAGLKIDYSLAENLQAYLSVDNLFNNVYSTKGLRWFNSLTMKWDKVFTPADLRSAQLGCKFNF